MRIGRVEVASAQAEGDEQDGCVPTVRFRRQIENVLHVNSAIVGHVEGHVGQMTVCLSGVFKCFPIETDENLVSK